MSIYAALARCLTPNHSTGNSAVSSMYMYDFLTEDTPSCTILSFIGLPLIS